MPTWASDERHQCQVCLANHLTKRLLGDVHKSKGQSCRVLTCSQNSDDSVTGSAAGFGASCLAAFAVAIIKAAIAGCIFHQWVQLGCVHRDGVQARSLWQLTRALLTEQLPGALALQPCT